MAYSTQSRSQEILRIVAVSMLGVILMVVQRWWFSAGVVDLNVPDDEQWARENFTPAAILVFLDSLFFALTWYFTALSSNKNYEPRHEKQLRLRWLGFFLAILLINVGVAVRFYGNASSTAFPLFVVLFLIDTTLIYWTSTAISTPGLLAYVVTGSAFLRKLFRIDR